MNRLFLKILYFVLVISLASCSTSKNVKERRTTRKVLTSTENDRREAKPTSNSVTKRPTTYSARTNMVISAENLIGTPYKYGGKDTQGLDCSGLVRYVYGQSGYNLKGSSKFLAKQGKSIKKSEAKAGDLLFFHKNGEVFHVSLVVENKRNDLWVVHSTSSKGVIKENIFASPYWNKKSFLLRQIVN